MELNIGGSCCHDYGSFGSARQPVTAVALAVALAIALAVALAVAIAVALVVAITVAITVATAVAVVVAVAVATAGVVATIYFVHWHWGLITSIATPTVTAAMTSHVMAMQRPL